MPSQPSIKPRKHLPDEPIDRLVAPIMRFLHVASAGGVVLLACTVAAVVLANSPYSDAYLEFWKMPVGLTIGDWEFRHSLRHWINDGLMVVFFFVVGLEVKRELMLGELRDRRAAALPAAAALGGMIVPAALYLALEPNSPARDGWGIPMATDIAFVVGCLALLGSRVPSGLRALLLSLAVVDDVGAILVIAVGYSGDLNWWMLGGGALGIAVVMLFARLGVRSVGVYTACGVGIWFGFHESGVHATVAGVILGLLTPVRPWVSEHGLVKLVDEVGDFFRGDPPEDPPKGEVLRHVAQAARETMSPLERLETRLHPWVSFVVMPVFALANAGVPIRLESLRESTAAAVAAGLCLGKPLGIGLFSWLAVKSRLARLPVGVTWKVLGAGGVLAGIGFTMSLFIAGLALSGPLLDAAKLGILGASALCAAGGLLLLYRLLPANRRYASAEAGIMAVHQPTPVGAE